MATVPSSSTKAGSTKTSSTMDLELLRKELAPHSKTAKLLETFGSWIDRMTGHLVQSAQQIQADAKDFKVVSKATHERAQLLHTEWRQEVATRESGFELIKKPLNLLKAIVMDREHKSIDPITAAMDDIGKKVRTYERDEEERARKEQERIDREEREKARLAAEAEAKRLEAEAKKAKGPEKQELKREAEMVRNAPPVPLTTTVVQTRTATVSTVARRENWKARPVAGLTDAQADEQLWQAVLAGKVSRAAFVRDQSWLDGQAKLNQTKMNVDPRPVPGFEAYDANADRLVGAGGRRS
jgi:hypothetical protein